VKLCPFEVAVQVVQVLDESMWIWEIVGERLGQCRLCYTLEESRCMKCIGRNI
jgi:hypothetical protein